VSAGRGRIGDPPHPLACALSAERPVSVIGAAVSLGTAARTSAIPGSASISDTQCFRRAAVILAVLSHTNELNRPELLAAGSIHGQDVSGPKQLGLLRRIENLYTRLPEHRERLQRGQQAGETLIGGAEQISQLPIPTDSTGEITG
jgi:hypothetical protein